MLTFADPVLPERYWEKVEVSPSGCWLWTASTGKGGYGRIAWQGRMRKAHVVMLETVLGEPLGDRDALHSCHHPSCVFPGHLRAGDHSENMQDRLAAGNHPMVNKTHCPKGHEYTPENTIIPDARSGRQCRICRRARDRARRAARKTPAVNT